jgi:hypothetical protein
VTALERPSLWLSRSAAQIFLVSKPTHPLGAGPAATATVDVPDLDSFRGSFGGKDVFPLYRDASKTPNTSAATLDAITAAHKENGSAGPAVAPEVLFAYAYGVLAGTDYTMRFAEELETPGPRVPLTADPKLFDEMANFGRELLWLHTFGERFADQEAAGAILHQGIRVASDIVDLPTTRGIRYDSDSKAIAIGEGLVVGVTPEVWAFEVSGMLVVRKWLGYRTRDGAGRAARSSSSLDAIRPDSWRPEWTHELLELLSVLQHTVDRLPRGAALLDRVCGGPLISADDLPPVPSELRRPPGGR